METATTRKPQARSRVTNGTSILPGVDGRTATMRRYRELLDQLTSELGNEASEAKNIIARRCATLAVWCEQVEADMANGQKIDMGGFITATNTLRRLLADLGLVEVKA